MIDFVIDASAGVEILLDTAVGRALDDRIPPNGQWWVPEHYFAEAANALRRVELRGTATSARTAAAFRRLHRAELRRYPIRPLMHRAWRRRGHMSFPDALYVSLAERLGAALVTSDMRMANSPGLTVSTITP